MTRSDRNWRLCNPVPRRRGFSLIEVMVTLAIVSVAALGMAGLQTVTLRANNNALLESQAATLAQDLLERIRANPAGNYIATLNAAVPGGNATCEGVAANCDAAAMAQYDIVQWKCSLGGIAMSETCAMRGIGGPLPNGDGSISIAGNIYTITIRWFDAASNENRTFVISSEI